MKEITEGKSAAFLNGSIRKKTVSAVRRCSVESRIANKIAEEFRQKKAKSK